jgi:hypothetical protein
MARLNFIALALKLQGRRQRMREEGKAHQTPRRKLLSASRQY